MGQQINQPQFDKSKGPNPMPGKGVVMPPQQGGNIAHQKQEQKPGQSQQPASPQQPKQSRLP